MPQPLPDQIIRRAEEVGGLYHRLVLLVAPAGSGKTPALREVGKRLDLPVINVNLELSRRMLDLTERQRALKVPHLLSQVTDQIKGAMVLLDNIEILFDVGLKQDPLRLLQGLSRSKSMVAAWNGKVRDGQLIYSEPGHREYRRYPAGELVLVSPDEA